MFLQIHIHMNSYIANFFAILPVPSHNIFKMWLGIDAMASQKIQEGWLRRIKIDPEIEIFQTLEGQFQVDPPRQILNVQCNL